MLSTSRRKIIPAVAIILAFVALTLIGCQVKNESRVSSPDQAAFKKMETEYYINSDGTATLTGL